MALVVIYSDQRLAFYRPTIFLAGPTPRRRDVASWRPAAIESLRAAGFDGIVFVPERRDFDEGFDYVDQVEWEYEGLERSVAIAFWIPRHLDTMPAFTTNVEFGRYVGSGRCVYGRPDGAPGTKYLDWLYAKLTGRPPLDTLDATMHAAAERAAMPGRPSRP